MCVCNQVRVQQDLDLTACKPKIEPIMEVQMSQEEADLMGTPLECPFDLDMLKIQDDDFYSKEARDSNHHSELKSCQYKPFSSFEAR